jgi:Predicted RNA polymerase sigma factor containing a TPR repeat domain
VTATDTHRAIDAVWRIEQAKLIAGLTRMVRDVGIAEELAQEALVAALEQWPKSGIPERPGAWLMASAKHRAIDLFRRNKLLERKHKELGYELEKSSRRRRNPISMPRSTIKLATICCALSSFLAIRRFRPRHVLRSRCACLEA